jgi:uncharacterized protein (DUF169 family)
MKTLEDYKKAGKDLYDRLHLSTYPIAIKYIKDMDEVPEGVMHPSNFGQKLSLCQAFTQSRRWGTSIVMMSEDNFCTPATAFHGWEKVSAEELIESQVRQGWHKDRDAEKKRIEGGMKLLGSLKCEYRGLISSPLTETVIIPDTVLIYCDGVQLTHLIHAVSYEYKYVPISSFEGYGESCIKGGYAPFVTQSPQIVIPGAGDRSFAGIMDHELAMGLPESLLFYVLKNLFKSGGDMNIGYPMRFLMPLNITEDITPGFKFLREKMTEKK